MPRQAEGGREFRKAATFGITVTYDSEADHGTSQSKSQQGPDDNVEAICRVKTRYEEEKVRRAYAVRILESRERGRLTEPPLPSRRYDLLVDGVWGNEYSRLGNPALNIPTRLCVVVEDDTISQPSHEEAKPVLGWRVVL